jgi:predicted GNAT family acetyltransferase
MAWQFTENVEPYARSVWNVLAGNPVEHTVALSVIESVRAGYRWSERGRMLFGCYDDGEVRGAVSLTPPFELLLTLVPEDTTAELVHALRRQGTSVPGVNGDSETVARFVAAWTSATGQRAQPERQMRLYRLATLRPPAPAPPGRARQAGVDDLEAAVRLVSEFQTEAEVPATDIEAAMRMAIGDGRVWLWEDHAQSVAALASRTRTAAGVARIAPVYTVPEQRRRGYGAAVTAACTQDALERGAEHAVLFTDLANPTSNSIYQQIGFTPVRDQHVVQFKNSPLRVSPNCA